MLIGVLRQGLRLARDFNLDQLGWLTEAAFAYVGDSVWEPLAPPAHGHESAVLSTPADALVETLSTLARRQREHRARTVELLTAVIDSGLLPAELQEMPVYYRAKALRDIGRTEDSRRGYQQVADGGGRLAQAARRGLAQAARLAGDFPTMLSAAQTLGWEGRHQRVLGDLYWIQGEPQCAAETYLAGRLEAEQHSKAGEAAHNQALRALALAFVDPRQAATNSTSPSNSSPASTCAPRRSTPPSPPSSATPAVQPSKTVLAPHPLLRVADRVPAAAPHRRVSHRRQRAGASRSVGTHRGHPCSGHRPPRRGPAAAAPRHHRRTPGHTRRPGDGGPYTRSSGAGTGSRPSPAVSAGHVAEAVCRLSTIWGGRTARAGALSVEAR
ncbi:hypothetical protein [Streptomyces sp. Ag82_O1-15]|uniref:hypothetical protein n=1 Tax=Streptomyces sp. Ag82_O1-15 TaxID=1938855 RepID=UPI0015C9667C|nr:hypothetical protein [Streptomyces sp. Ag82_O1-15]